MVSDKSLLFIAKLGWWSLLIALVYRISGTEVVYQSAITSFQQAKYIRMLARIGINLIDYGQFRYYDLKKLYFKKNELAEQIIEQLITPEVLNQALQQFQLKKTDELRLKTVLIDMVVRFLSLERFIDFLICYEYFNSEYKTVSVIANLNPYQRLAALESLKQARQIVPSFMYYIALLFKSLTFVSTVLTKSLLAQLSFGTKGSLAEPIHQPKAYQAEPVLYFPHQGISYGSLINKDHYYSEDPSSAFHKSKIYHLEYGSLNQTVVQSYQELKLRYAYLNNLSSFELIKACFAYLKAQHKYIKLSSFFNRTYYLAQLLVAMSYIRYCSYTKALQPYSQAKLALVGYDALFPKTLSLALYNLGIKTLATQERFGQAFFGITNVSLDYYLVSSDYAKQAIQNKKSSYAERIESIGMLRTDDLLEFKKKSKPAKAKMVLVYDFHSSPNYYLDKIDSPVQNWSSNKDFYYDILRLAKEFPQTHFIIRGKDDHWCKLDYFKEVYELLSLQQNIELCRDYSRVNISYELAAQADLIVAKYTSIADEALSCGIPVIFHDYSRCTKKQLSSFLEYDSMPIFAYSYEELKSRVSETLLQENYLAADRLSNLQESYFSNLSDGRVKLRLQQKMHKFLQSLKNTKVTLI